MTPRLWEMSDEDIRTLLARAKLVQAELEFRQHAVEGQIWVNRQRLTLEKRKSPEWHKIERQIYSAQRDLDGIEQRIDAQKTVIRSFQNEYEARHPRVWTRSDLERINRQRGR